MGCVYVFELVFLCLFGYIPGMEWLGHLAILYCCSRPQKPSSSSLWKLRCKPAAPCSAPHWEQIYSHWHCQEGRQKEEWNGARTHLMDQLYSSYNQVISPKDSSPFDTPLPGSPLWNAASLGMGSALEKECHRYRVPENLALLGDICNRFRAWRELKGRLEGACNNTRSTEIFKYPFYWLCKANLISIEETKTQELCN